MPKVYGGMTNAGSRFVKPDPKAWECPVHGPQPKHRLNCPERGCTARQRP